MLYVIYDVSKLVHLMDNVIMCKWYMVYSKWSLHVRVVTGGAYYLYYVIAAHHQYLGTWREFYMFNIRQVSHDILAQAISVVHVI